ncbi:unnamed protein product [Phaedon cochleariae]|uniref:Phosphatidic acid phosphatase type 2/haloperoxidase domain-containing protein n=1 Tax=Phaedon cochleariae TaxID=80249 RepID=A0A9P0GM18_PHACE|nr:unnamed protein product [Phaedon cochleariae]
MDTTITVINLILETGFRLGIWILFLWLDKHGPIIRHIDEDEMWMYRYPSMDSIVPKFYLYVIICVFPLIVFFLQFVINGRREQTIPDIFQSISGLTLAYCINGILTTTLKLTLGRPRPNFFHRCFPDGYGTDIDNCTGEYHGMLDGRKSFPSAHASFAFTCMVYLTLHINKLIDLKKVRVCRGILMFLMMVPILLATLIAVSRCADYHHHYTDVIGGAILGTSIAVLTQNIYSTVDAKEAEEILELVEKYSYISLVPKGKQI